METSEKLRKHSLMGPREATGPEFLLIDVCELLMDIAFFSLCVSFSFFLFTSCYQTFHALQDPDLSTSFQGLPWLRLIPLQLISLLSGQQATKAFPVRNDPDSSFFPHMLFP